MEITKEIIEERIENLEGQREQSVAHLNAILGAIGTLRQLITELETEDAFNEEG